jgi:ferritin-like metal-binding protein YciE
MNQLKTMRDLLVHDVQMMYSAETQGLEGLATLVDSATDPQLKAAFQAHGVETQRQVARLEQIMTMLDAKPSREVCSAMQGLLTDAEKLMRKESTPEVLDAMLIAAAQKMEHYEIACYGTAVRMTEDLGMTQACELLRQTLEEEKRTDEILTSIAEQMVNVKAETKM